MKKRILAALFTLVLCLGLLPATALAAENTAPTVEQFATVDELRANFDMDDSTDKIFKKIYFGYSGDIACQWSIVGVDPVGKGLVLLFKFLLCLGAIFPAALRSKTMTPTGELRMKMDLYL